MKNLFKIVGLGFVLISILGAKKGVDLFSVSKQLKYALQGIPKINFSNKSIKINLKVINPTNIMFNSSYFSIENITLGLPNKEPFAVSTKKINNISINPNGHTIIKDIEFIINLSLIEIVKLATNIRSLELNLNIKFQNQSIKMVKLKLADFI